MAIWGVKTGLLWHAGYGVGCFIWKVFSVPYNIPVHGKTCIMVIFDLLMLIHSGGGSKMRPFLWWKLGFYGWLVLGGGIPPEKHLVWHITSQFMTKHYLGSYMLLQYTLMAQNTSFLGVKTGYHGRMFRGWGPNLEIVYCAISHLITWLNMCHGYLWPLQYPVTFIAQEKSHIWVEIRLLWKASYRMGWII